MQQGEFSPRKYLDETMRKGIASIVVLIHIKKKSNYPYALMKAFKRSHHPILANMDKSQIYNILNALERDGFVKSRTKRVGGKSQKVYSVTPKGDAIVSSFKELFSRFVLEAKALIKSELVD
jgi:DNA-binding PadR family transcriptional regulator